MSSIKFSSYTIKNNFEKNDFLSISGKTRLRDSSYQVPEQYRILPVMSGLYSWYKIDLGNLSMSSNSVTEWRDVIGNSSPLYPADVGYPTYVENSWNGLPGISFSGSGADIMESSGDSIWNSFPNYTIESPPPGKTRTTQNFKLRYGVTIFLVAKHDSFSTANNCPLSLNMSMLNNNTGRGNSFIFNYSGTNGANPSIYIGKNSSNVDMGVNTTGVNLGTSSPYLYTYQFTTGTANQIFIRINGTNYSFSNMGGGVGFNMRNFHTNPSDPYITIGGYRDITTSTITPGSSPLSGFFDGTIYDIIIYKNELTSTEIGTMESFLMNKWAI